MPYRRRPKTQARRKRRQAKPYAKVYRKTTTVARIPRPIGRKGPFPRTMNTTLLYKAPSVNVTSAGISSYNYASFGLNNMYDFDIDNIVNNKQPLFFDTLVTSNGPYRNYKVNAWKTTIRFINLSDKAMFVYYDPFAGTYAVETDTAGEMQNRRGVQSFTLTAQANAKPMITIKSFKTLKSCYPNGVNQSENFAGSSSSAPSSVAYGTLGWQTIDGSTAAFTVAIQIQHIFYATLYNADSTQS